MTTHLDENLGKALALATGHVNASTRDPITGPKLLLALQTGVVPAPYRHHVHAFFDETHAATMTELVLARGVSYGQLAALADRMLPARHRTRLWLDDRRAL